MDFDKIDSRQIEKTIQSINAAINDKEVKPGFKQKLNYAKKHWPAALEKYDTQQQIMGTNRNIYIKTDPDTKN